MEEKENTLPKHNMLFGKELNDAFERVCLLLENLLTQYCGPNAGYMALFDTTMNGQRSAKFTKDGINVISELRLKRPEDEYILSLLQTVGRGMESKVGDGTTSSILLCIKSLNKLRDMTRTKHITYRKFVTTYCKLIRELERRMEALKIRGTDEASIRGIAYHQAMTSSHQDAEMSAIVAELFSTIPVKAWTNISYRMEAYETERRFHLEYDEASYACKATLYDNTMFTDELGIEADHTGKVIILPMQPTYGSEMYEKLKTIISEQASKTESIMIICETPDNVIGREISEIYNKEFYKGNVVGFYWLTGTNNQMVMCTDLDALCSCAGYDRRQEKMPIVLSGIRTRWTAGRLQVFNLCKYDKTGRHSDLEDSLSPMHKFIRLLNKKIEELTNTLDRNKATEVTIRELTKMKNIVEFQKAGQIVIGGPVYEQIASKDVVDDVVKSVSISLREGCLLGGFRSAMCCIEELLKETSEQDCCEQLILTVLLQVIREFNIQMYRQGKSEDIAIPSKVTDGRYSMDILQDMFIEFSKDSLSDLSHPMILQSKDSYSEFFKRFGDVIPRMIYTSGISIPRFQFD